MEKDLKFNWTKYRNKWVWHHGKKIKLRKYIAINAMIMKHKNKPGWEGVDHYLNYKIALSRYGLEGLKHYEDFFYRNLPMPYNRNWFQHLKVWITKQINRIKK